MKLSFSIKGWNCRDFDEYISTAKEYGEVHFIKEEFESILNEVYNAGYHDGLKSRQNIWTSPNTWGNYKPYCADNGSNLGSIKYDISNDNIHINDSIK